MALQLATEWLAEQGDGCFTIICSESQAALSALNGSCISDGKGLAVVHSNLAQSNRRILLQWVPGHCGLIGNEWADVAAGEAATTVTPNLVHQQAITYKTAKALIGRELVDPPTTHVRTKAVFDGPRNQPLSRGEAVLIAQLRSGHCRKLAAYRSIVETNFSPICPLCDMEAETLEHWLQDCPATAVKRILVFGEVALQLSVLVTSPKTVLAFAHGLWPV